jgi:hypothetical protein
MSIVDTDDTSFSNNFPTYQAQAFGEGTAQDSDISQQCRAVFESKPNHSHSYDQNENP